MASGLADVVRLVVDQRAEQVAAVPLGDLGAQVEDLVIPTDDDQDGSSESIYVSFTTYARHEIIRPNRLALPDWLKVHRAGDVTVVCVLVACDFTMPHSWCWRPAPLPDDRAPVPQRLILATLNDGVGVVRVEQPDEVAYGRLPGLATAMWPKALHEAAVTYLSHRPSTSILGDSSRLKPR